MEEKLQKKSKKGLIIGTIVGIVMVVVIIGGIALYNNEVLSKIGIFSNNKASEKNIAGTYELVEMSDTTQIYSTEDLESLKKLGITLSMELREDRTGAIDLFGEAMELTYDSKNITVNDQPAPYTIYEDRITLEKDGDKLVFQKVTTEE